MKEKQCFQTTLTEHIQITFRLQFSYLRLVVPFFVFAFKHQCSKDCVNADKHWTQMNAPQNKGLRESRTSISHPLSVTYQAPKHIWDPLDGNYQISCREARTLPQTQKLCCWQNPNSGLPHGSAEPKVQWLSLTMEVPPSWSRDATQPG